MNPAVAGDLCRLTVVAPTGRADIAVPADLAVAHLLPILLRQAAVSPEPSGGHWVLQRLGETPLDLESTVAQLGLRDGDVLHLRPAAAVMPPIDFDDIVDGVSTAIQQRGDTWRPAYTRALLLGAGGVALAAGLAAVLLGSHPQARPLVLAVLAVLLLGGAAAFSRALGDRGAAILLAAAGFGYAAVAGALLPAAFGFDGTAVLAGGAVAGCAAVLASAGVGAARPFFAGLACVAVTAALGGLLTVWPGLSGAAAAGAVAAVAYLLSVMLPNLVARLVKLRVPALPSGAGDLDRDIEPHPERQLLARANAADGYLTAFGAAVAVLCLGAFVPLIAAGTPMALGLVGAICLGLLLRCRGLVAVGQRLSAAVPAVLGLAFMLIGLAARSGDAGSFTAGAVAVLGAGGLAVRARRSPDQRDSPYWSRAGDLLETATAIAVVPLAIGVLGGYAFARGLAG